MTKSLQVFPIEHESGKLKPESRAAAYRTFIEGAREVLGTEGLNSLAVELDPENVSISEAAGALLLDLEEKFGTVGGSGLSQRIGRAMFRYGLKEFGEQAGFRTVVFRILPSPHRVEKGLRVLSSLFSDLTDQPVQVDDQGSAWMFSMPCCPAASSGSGGQLYAHLVKGLIQEFTSWAGGGRYYPVVETACRAAGAPACIFRIDKKPLD